MIKNIFLFFRKIFIKENIIKIVEAPKETVSKESSNNFIASLKSNVVKKKKKEVETLTCVGDGLGIQNKINF